MKKSTKKQVFILFGIALCVVLYGLSDYVATPHETEGFVEACTKHWDKHDITSSTSAKDPRAICECISDHMHKDNADIIHYTTLSAWFSMDKRNRSSHRNNLYGEESDMLFMDGLLYCVNQSL